MRQGFGDTFAPEIAMLTPPPAASPREASSTPSTIIRGSLASGDQSPRCPNTASPLSGSKAKETAVIQQLPLRHRGARLSFLSSRKQEAEPAAEADKANGEGETASSHKRSLSKGPGFRHSIFRSPSANKSHEDGHVGSARRSSSVGKDSLDGRGSVQEDGGAAAADNASGIGKRGGSMRKRLSRLNLKLGKKGAKGQGCAMGSLDEE